MAPHGDRREISGVTTSLILGYVATTYGDDAVSGMLRRAGVAGHAAALRDERSWWSQDTKTALFSAAAEVTGDPAVARRVGEHVVTPVLGGTFKYPMTAEGSAQAVFTNIAAAVTKFSTIANVRAVEVGDVSAVLHFWLDGPARATRFDCDYLQGLASTVPRLFGRQYAQVQQTQCQIEGAPHCVVSVRWAHADVTTPGDSFELEAARAQLHALQDAMADLVSLDDLDALLTRVAERASIAIRAQRYLLAVRLSDADPLQVRADGITAETAEALAGALLDPAIPDDPDAVIVDIASRRRWYGRLAAYLPAGRSVFAAEDDLLRAYGRVVSAALDSATALASARAQRRTAEALLRVSTMLADCASARDIADVASSSVMDMVGAPAACVLLWNVDDDAVVPDALHGAWPEARVSALHDLAAGPVPARAWPHVRRVGLLADDDGDDSALGSLPGHLGVARVAVVPIANGDTLRGCALGLWPRVTGDVPADAIVRLQGLSDQASIAMARAALLREVRRQASHDDLTGLPRRPLLVDRLGQAMARQRRTGEQVAVLFVDLDGFKEVNDSYGHAAGDAVLRSVGARMSAAVRDTDTVARIGGDEFAVLLSDVGSPGRIRTVADKLIAAIALPIVLDDGEVASVGGSVGIACLEPGATDVGGVLRRADQAMYAAKRAGGGWKMHTAVR